MRALRFTFALLLVSALTLQAENRNIEPLGFYNTEWYHSVAVAEDYAYCGTAFGLLVMDVSDKENPFIVEHLETPGQGQGVTIEGSLLYLCDGSDGIRIYSLEQPDHPVLVNVWEDIGNALKLKIRDGIGYLAQGRAFTTIDLSEPENPGMLDRLVFPCVVIALRGNYAFNSKSYLRTIDITDPADLQQVAQSDLRNGMDVTAVDDLLFGGLFMYSIADPLNIELVFHFRTGGGNHAIVDHYIFGGTAYGEHPTDDLYCFDFSGHDSLFLIDSCPITFPVVSDMCYDNGFVFQVGQGHMTIIDAQDMENLHEISVLAFENPANFCSIACYGDYVYSYDVVGRLWTINFNDPAAPEATQITDWNIGSGGNFYDPIKLKTHGETLFSVQDFSGTQDGERVVHRGVITYSLDDPSHPIERGVFNNLSQYYDMDFKENFLFGVVPQNGMLEVVNFGDLDHPEMTFEYDLGNNSYCININQNVLAASYCELNHADETNGIKLFNISDQTCPK